VLEDVQEDLHQLIVLIVPPDIMMLELLLLLIVQPVLASMHLVQLALDQLLVLPVVMVIYQLIHAMPHKDLHVHLTNMKILLLTHVQPVMLLVPPAHVLDLSVHIAQIPVLLDM
jgi:hypothetical protein